MAKYDWLLLKTEYVNSTISLRDLAVKHKVNFSSMSKKAVNEEWLKAREQKCNNIETKVQQNSENAEVDRLTRLLTVSDKALQKLEKAIEQLENNKGEVDKFGLKQLISAMKDLKEVQKVDSGEKPQDAAEPVFNFIFEDTRIKSE